MKGRVLSTSELYEYMSNSTDPISLDHVTIISPEDIRPDDSDRYTRYSSIVKLTKTREQDLLLQWTVQEVSEYSDNRPKYLDPNKLNWKSTKEGAKELATLCKSQILISRGHWLTFIPLEVITDRFGGQLREIRVPIRTHFSTLSSIDRRPDTEQRDQTLTDKGEVSFVWSYGDDTSQPGA